MFKCSILTASLLSTLLLSGCQSRNTPNDANSTTVSISEVSSSDEFHNKNDKWSEQSGKWVFASDKVTQVETKESYPLLLLLDKKYSNVDITVKFKPISGQIDASGGIVFRAQDGQNYYIVRANALEDNFRLYYFKDGYRHQMASATVVPPKFGQFSTMRVVADGGHIQAFLNGKMYLDYHDSMFKSGFVGLWTKEDSVTSFIDFEASGK